MRPWLPTLCFGLSAGLATGACAPDEGASFCEHPISSTTAPDGCNTCHECEDGDWSCTAKSCGVGLPVDGGCLSVPCIDDDDPDEPGVQPACSVEFWDESGADIQVPECAGTPDTPELPDGAEICFVLDEAASFGPECTDLGYVLGMRFEFAETPAADWEAGVFCRALEYAEYREGATCHGPGVE